MNEWNGTVSPGLVEAERRIADAAARGSDRLSLSSLDLKALPKLPTALQNLRILNLSGNRLKSLCHDVATLVYLESLDLGNNRFEAVPIEVLHLKQLVSLDLSQNRLTTLVPGISALTNLRELSLYQNRLREIPEKLFSLAHLKRLDLAKNQLSSLPTFDNSLLGLEILDLSGNKLCSIPVGLDQLVALRSLSLAGNRITSAEGIGSLDQLEEIDLSMNCLTEPPLSVLELKHLRVLEAGGNPFGPMPTTLSCLAGDEVKKRAAAAIESFVTGGMQPGTMYFEPVSFLFGCFVAIGGLTSVSYAVDRFYKRFSDITSVMLELPSGVRLTLGNLSYKKALEIVREHEAELSTATARVDLGQTKHAKEVERIKAFAVDILTRVPGSSLLPKKEGAAQQYIICNGPVYSPVMIGQFAKEEIMGDKITITNVQNSVIDVKSKLHQVTQTINTTPIDTNKKDELKVLVDQLNNALERLPTEKRENAEMVADMVKDTMEKITQPNPNKKMLEFSLKGIKEAAKDLTEALPVAVKLAATVAEIFGLTL